MEGHRLCHDGAKPACSCRLHSGCSAPTGPLISRRAAAGHVPQSRPEGEGEDAELAFEEAIYLDPHRTDSFEEWCAALAAHEATAASWRR